MNYKKSFCCETELNKEGLCKCETLHVSKYTLCPECGSYTYSYNDPGRDPSFATHCTNKDCKYIDSDFLSWDDIKGDI